MSTGLEMPERRLCLGNYQQFSSAGGKRGGGLAGTDGGGGLVRGRSTGPSQAGAELR